MRMGGRWSVFRSRNVSILHPALCGINRKAKQMTDEQFYSGKTQVFWACKALLDGRTISHVNEIQEVRGWRLGAVIHRLKTDYAWPIQTRYRSPDNVAFYSLKADVDRAALLLPPSAKALGQAEDAQ
jgi:hypothetical protein